MIKYISREDLIIRKLNQEIAKLKKRIWQLNKKVIKLQTKLKEQKMKKDKSFECKECHKVLREKSVTQEMVDLKLCPQCYTMEITKEKK